MTTINTRVFPILGSPTPSGDLYVIERWHNGLLYLYRYAYMTEHAAREVKQAIDLWAAKDGDSHVELMANWFKASTPLCCVAPKKHDGAVLLVESTGQVSPEATKVPDLDWTKDTPAEAARREREAIRGMRKERSKQPGTTIVLNYEGITRRYPCEGVFDAIVLKDALERRYGANHVSEE